MKFFTHLLFFFLVTTQICFGQWIQTSMTSRDVQCLAVSGTNIFAGTLFYGIYLTTNNGANWAVVNSGLTDRDVTALAVSNNNLFAGTYNGGVFRSTNNGTNWTPVNSGLSSYHISNLAVRNTILFASPVCVGIFRSTNYGASWIASNNGLTEPCLVGLAVINSKIFTGSFSNGEIFLSTDDGLSWSLQQIGSPYLYVNSFTLRGENIYSGSDYGVYRSSDDGANWTAVNAGIENIEVVDIAANGLHLFAATFGSGVFLSTNGGTSWIAVNTGLTNLYLRSIMVKDTNLFVGTGGAGVWRRPLSDIVTYMKEDFLDLPTEFSLIQNYPNPFNPSTKIKYSIPQDVKSKTQDVNLIVYDVLGNEIEILVDEEKPAGTYEVTWYAEGLPSGVYFYQLRAGNFVETKKMILLR